MSAAPLQRRRAYLAHQAPKEREAPDDMLLSPVTRRKRIAHAVDTLLARLMFSLVTGLVVWTGLIFAYRMSTKYTGYPEAAAVARGMLALSECWPCTAVSIVHPATCAIVGFGLGILALSTALGALGIACLCPGLAD